MPQTEGYTFRICFVTTIREDVINDYCFNGVVTQSLVFMSNLLVYNNYVCFYNMYNPMVPQTASKMNGVMLVLAILDDNYYPQYYTVLQGNIDPAEEYPCFYPENEVTSMVSIKGNFRTRMNKFIR